MAPFPEVVLDPTVPDDEIHLVSGDSRTVIRIGAPVTSQLPIDAALAALIAEQAIDLFLENRDVHGHDEARAKREAVTGVSEGASTATEEG